MPAAKKTPVGDNLTVTDENVKKFDPNKDYKILKIVAKGDANNPRKSADPKFKERLIPVEQLASMGITTLKDFREKNPMNLETGKIFHLYEFDDKSPELFYFGIAEFLKPSTVLSDEITPPPPEPAKDKLPADMKAVYENLIKDKDSQITNLNAQVLAFQTELSGIHKDYAGKLEAKDDTIKELEKKIAEDEFERKVDARVIELLKENPKQSGGLMDNVKAVADLIPGEAWASFLGGFGQGLGQGSGRGISKIVGRFIPDSVTGESSEENTGGGLTNIAGV